VRSESLTVRERAPIYGLLTRLLVREVDAETWRALRDPVLVEFFEAAVPEFGRWISAEPEKERLDTLAEEFAKLFLVPGGVPLFASAWIEGDARKIADDLAGFVSAALETLGREPLRAEPWGRLPLDHLALWMDLIATASAESPELASHLEEELMGPWVIALGRALEQKATAPLYRGVGALLQALRD
jgi:TorA maturation chaperone TorD